MSEASQPYKRTEIFNPIRVESNLPLDKCFDRCYLGLNRAKLLSFLPVSSEHGFRLVIPFGEGAIFANCLCIVTTAEATVRIRAAQPQLMGAEPLKSRLSIRPSPLWQLEQVSIFSMATSGSHSHVKFGFVFFAQDLSKPNAPQERVSGDATADLTSDSIAFRVLEAKNIW